MRLAASVEHEGSVKGRRERGMRPLLNVRRRQPLAITATTTIEEAPRRRHHQHRNRRPTTIVPSGLYVHLIYVRRRSFAYNAAHHDSGCNFLQRRERCANKSARPCLQTRLEIAITRREKSLLNTSLYFSLKYTCKVHKLYIETRVRRLVRNPFISC